MIFWKVTLRICLSGQPCQPERGIYHSVVWYIPHSAFQNIVIYHIIIISFYSIFRRDMCAGDANYYSDSE